jgi:hypothetical protein
MRYFGSALGDIGKTTICVSWPKPGEGWIALSVDGSYQADGGGGTGIIGCDMNGNVIFFCFSTACFL